MIGKQYGIKRRDYINYRKATICNFAIPFVADFFPVQIMHWETQLLNEKLSTLLYWERHFIALLFTQISLPGLQRAKRYMISLPWAGILSGVQKPAKSLMSPGPHH